MNAEMDMIKFVIIGLIVICLIVLLYFTGESEEEHKPRNFRNDQSVPIRLGEITVDKLVLNPEFYQDAKEVTRFYTEQLDRTEAQTLQTAEIEEHNDNIATLNVHFFHPINLEHKKKEVMEAPLKFMRRFNISVLILQESLQLLWNDLDYFILWMILIIILERPKHQLLIWLFHDTLLL